MCLFSLYTNPRVLKHSSPICHWRWKPRVIKETRSTIMVSIRTVTHSFSGTHNGKVKAPFKSAPLTAYRLRYNLNTVAVCILVIMSSALSGPMWSITHIFSCDQAAQQMVFSVRPSVRLSVCLSHLFHHVPIIVSSWNFQELLPWSKVMSMQKVKDRGQRSRSQRSTPNLAVSGL